MLPHFDLSTGEAAEGHDLDNLFRLLRAEDPVYWSADTDSHEGFWSVTKYADVLFVSRNPKVFTSSHGIAGPRTRHGGPAPAVDIKGSILTMDPPRHAELRRALNAAFTPRSVERLRHRVERVCAEILDHVPNPLACEFVSEVASRVPLTVICEVLGLPRGQWSRVLELSNLVVGNEDPQFQRLAGVTTQTTSRLRARTAAVGRRELVSIIHDAVVLRSHDPDGGLVSALLAQHDLHQHVSPRELEEFLLLLLLAGNETTRHALSGGLLALISRPDAVASVRADSALLGPAVEEILRWTSPIQHMARDTTADIQLRDKTIRRGSRILIWYRSANFDEDVFVEPEVFDITRHPNEHVAFGTGEHFCLGAPLARLEISVLLEQLLQRWHGITLLARPTPIRSNFIAGLKDLLVCLQ